MPERSDARHGAARSRSPSPSPGLRERILGIVSANPALTTAELTRRLLVPAPLVHYHASRLEAQGMLVRRRYGRHVRLFPADWSWDSVDEDMAIVQEPSALKIARLIVEHPGIGLPEVVERSGESARVVYLHVKRFRDAGLVAAPGARHLGLLASPRLYELVTRRL